MNPSPPDPLSRALERGSGTLTPTLSQGERELPA
jgi:hypothetical protein